MKLLPDPVDLATAAIPLSPVLRFLGLFPRADTLDGHPRRQQVHSGAVCLAITTTFLCNGYIKVSSDWGHSVTLKACIVFNDVIMFLACLSNVLLVLRHRVSLVRTLQELTAIGTVSVSQTHPGVCKVFRKVVLRKALCMLVTVCVIMVDTVHEFNQYGGSIGFITFVIASHFTFLKFATIQFELWLIALKLELQLVNSEILGISRWLSKSHNLVPFIQLILPFPSQRSHVLNRIQKLRYSHLRLLKLSNSLTKMYGIPLLLSVASIFLNTIYYLYIGAFFFPKNGFDGASNLSIYLLVFVALEAVVFATMLLELAAECSYTCREYGRTAVLVQEMLLDGNKMDTDISEALAQFKRQVLDLKMKFTSCGFFELNFGLVGSMAGFVTTYLVILLQFQR